VRHAQLGERRDFADVLAYRLEAVFDEVQDLEVIAGPRASAWGQIYTSMRTHIPKIYDLEFA